MKQVLFISFCLFHLSVAFSQSRNFRLVKAPTDKPANQTRKAVVIGMSDYDNGRGLNNTINDANDMTEVLTQLGFEVTLLKNNDLRNLQTNLNTWYASIENNDMAVFYFAGHGIEVNGQNFLIPIGAELNSATDALYNTLNVNQVLGNMDERKVGMKLIILDACRDNPFKRSWTRGTESKGLAQMSAPKGTYIAFAALPGYTAQDGGSYNLENGVFTYYLKQEIMRPGLTIDQIFNKITNDVANLTNDQQTPFKNSSIRSDFYFIPKSNDAPVTPPKKYYFYVDQRGNKSTREFDSYIDAENYMKSNQLFGKIYSNMGEAFVIDAPIPVPKTVENKVIKKAVQEQLALADKHFKEANYSRALETYKTIDESDLSGDLLDRVGDLYDRLTYYDRDLVKAVYYYRKSSAAGSASGMEDLANKFRSGEGLVKNIDSAIYWYNKAAGMSNNWWPLIFISRDLYKPGNTPVADLPRVVDCLQKASNGGVKEAMTALANLYYKGEGVGKDETKARYWFQKAAAAGDESAKKAITDLRL